MRQYIVWYIVLLSYFVDVVIVQCTPSAGEHRYQGQVCVCRLSAQSGGGERLSKRMALGGNN